MTNNSQEYNYYNNELVPAGFGLNNIGANCWCNSLVQILLGLPSLNRILLTYEHEFANNIFAREYIKVIKAALPQFTQPDVTKLMSASTSILSAMIVRMKQKGLKINFGVGQECVDEAFTFLIELFENPRIENLFNNIYELVVECSGCKQKVSTTRDKSYRIQLFTQIKLDTQQKFCTFLRIHPSECDYYKCDCGTIMTKFYRGEKLKMLREIVVIIFNKFQLKDNRWFPQELIFKSCNDTYLHYRLVGKIEHSGNQFGGHYWAQSLRNGRWYKFNDASVMEGDCNPSPSTFMIVYHLYDPRNAQFNTN